MVTTPDNPAPPGKALATILVVDDSRINLKGVSRMLEGHFRVLTAESGPIALQIAAAEPRPDLILLDVMMPEMDGYEVIQRLQGNEATRDIPVIFVTARVNDEDEQHGLSLGAADYITKPLRPAILLARIRNHLKLKQAQDALRDYNTALESSVAERTATLSAVLDSADQLIVMITLDGAIMAINRIGAEQFGLTPTRLAGCNLFDLLPSEFGIPLADLIAEVMDTGRSAEIDAARDKRIFHVTVYPVPGEPPRVVVYASDVTDKVAADAMLRTEREQLAASLAHQRELNRKLEEAQNQLLQSEKMASLGQLAAGVAHELNNPIGFVRSNVTTLKGYLDSLFGIIQAYDTKAAESMPPEALAALAAIKQREDFDFLHEDIFQLLAESQDGLTRVQDIVQNLKDFSRVGESGFGWADLHACLDSTLNIIWNELKYKCTVVKHYDQTLPQVYCIASQLNQVFMNLLVNAGHAIAEKGEITITTRQTPDGTVQVAISDTGCGIAAEHLPHLFEPFFTTKPIGKGTGLGLSITYGIIGKHKGSIDVSSEVGKGTTFTVNLPVDRSDEAEDSPPNALAA
ncbi:response regulator [Zoogloea ramigera]|uniref:response regulator n=1 Tax=Zoogloea ramigera TaxID=350 RepID=UPI003FA1F540